jgi:hypothetical protein
MEDMIVRKVQLYLDDYVGERAMLGTPTFSSGTRHWRVPILARTPEGILPVGECVLDENGEFLSLPTEEQMLRVLQSQMKRLPFLVYGEKAELEAKGLELVTV